MADGSCGILMVVLESVRYLGDALSSTNLECAISVGESHEETRCSGTYTMDIEEFGPKMKPRLQELLYGGDADSDRDDVNATSKKSGKSPVSSPIVGTLIT